MRYINVTDAREDLLNIVKNGDQVTVTRNGKPSVVILPFGEYQQLAALRDAARDPEEFLAAFHAHRAVQHGTRTSEFSELDIGQRLEEIERTLIEKASGIEKDIKKLQSTVQRIESVSSKATA